jgi:hypothetical protein
VADRFALLEFGPLRSQRPLPAAGRTGPTAVGTGLFLGQGGTLAFQEGRQDAFGQPRGGGLSDRLHRIEVDIESGSVVAEGPTGDDFPRLGRELAKVVEFPTG